MQYLDCELAWWFNVGVQIFLCISGFLYGNKKINMLTFYKKSFLKILVSFYVVFFPFAMILYFMNQTGFGRMFFCALLTNFLPGGEHLWFIPTILCCYIITPFLSAYFNKNNNFNLIIRYILALLGTYFVFKYFVTAFNGAWISCYITGFFLSKIEYTKLYKTISFCFIALAIITNGIQISVDYFNLFAIPAYIFTTFCNYSHMLLGISLFLIFKFLFKNIKENKLLSFSDKYSYEIYLVHQFFILGPISFMKLTPYTALNIFIICIAILICGITAKTVSDFIHNSINKMLLKDI